MRLYNKSREEEEKKRKEEDSKLLKETIRLAEIATNE